MPNEPPWLRFGIPSLDELINRDHEGGGIQIARTLSGTLPSSETQSTTSVCIIGPDGTGKSIFAMHMAAYYGADCFEAADGDPTRAVPLVFYASTDLKYDRASEMWSKFGLAEPLRRDIPFAPEPAKHRQSAAVRLVPYPPSRGTDGNPGKLAEHLCGHTPADGSVVVVFVDLASETAGDDWGYLSRILALLQPAKPGEPSHLMIIDAVEGLETLVGERDAFGEERSRRSRIAQIMRTAQGRAHLGLVTEEASEDKRLPEEFVADVVIRLRSHEVPGGGQSYLRRTVEVEKARAQKHVRGRHPFVIRDGGGSSTGTQPNADDPPVSHPNDSEPKMGYVQVFPSLHYVNRSIMEFRGGRVPLDVEDTLAGFGIEYLDNMLAHEPREQAERREQDDPWVCGFDPFGLPVGTITALTGESGTHRRRLARAFLSQCFADDEHRQAAVLLTTDDIDAEGLTDRIQSHLGRKLEPSEKDRVICRRLEIHDAPSATLFHIAKWSINEARVRLQRSFNEGVSTTTDERHKQGWRIRMVISNLETMRSTYPDVASDPLFLPTLLFYLRREGVTALIVSTDPGSIAQPDQDEFVRKLRSLATHNLRTWHVPFFGEDRVAIAAIPPVSNDRPAVIRELRSFIRRDDSMDEECLEVNPHLEMYTGLEHGSRPGLVPLTVRLFGGTTGFKSYLAEVNALFEDLFTDFPDTPIAVTGAREEEYEHLMSFSRLQGDTRRNSTLVFQVDEFWSQEPSGLYALDEYLFADVTRKDRTPIKVEDPYQLFQDPARADGPLQRVSFYKPIGFDYIQARAAGLTIDRAPYTWDFGLLLLRARAWRAALDRQVIINYASGPTDTAPPKHVQSTCTVRDIWCNLTHAVPVGSDRRSETLPLPIVSWRQFLAAAAVVARSDASQSSASPYSFDVDMLGPETLSCLVLEMWASEIQQTLTSLGWPDLPFKKFRHDCSPSNIGLMRLLEEYRPELFMVWLLLGEALSAAQFGTDWRSFEARPARRDAVASRHWYSTACGVVEERDIQDPMVPVRLPGSFSVRGDWFLAIAGGSRSPRLGQHAIDLLSSRRANVVRLQAGIGLPTRDFIADEDIKNEVWTNLFTVDKNGEKRPISYGELLGIGARETARQGEGTSDFSWLWRYTITGYDRQARLWLKLLRRILFRWRELMDLDKERRLGRNGLEAYDTFRSEWTSQLGDAVAGSEEQGGTERQKEILVRAEERLVEAGLYPSYSEFRRECGTWIKGLQQTSVAGGQ